MESLNNKTNGNIKIENLNKSQTLEFIEDDIKINLAFFYDDKHIIFKVTHFTIPTSEYESTKSLEELYQINRYFNNFEKSIDLINSLIETFNDKKSKIIFKENNCDLIVYNPITKKTFELNLNKKEKKVNSQIDELINIVNEDRKRIQTLENKVNDLEKIILEFKEKEKVKEKKKLNNFFKESNILNEEEKKLIISWLNFKPKNINLLLNSNRDGDSFEAFHRLCDGKAPTIGIIETTKGHKFGGFTTQLWNGKSNENFCKTDNNAFIFSLDTKRKYNVINSDKAIGSGTNWLLFFGYTLNSIVTFSNGCSNNNNHIGNGAYNFDNKNVNGGEQYFTMKSFEVYEIK